MHDQQTDIQPFSGAVILCLQILFFCLIFVWAQLPNLVGSYGVLRTWLVGCWLPSARSALWLLHRAFRTFILLCITTMYVHGSVLRT
jgi:hypothetical protein